MLTTIILLSDRSSALPVSSLSFLFVWFYFELFVGWLVLLCLDMLLLLSSPAPLSLNLIS